MAKHGKKKKDDIMELNRVPSMTAYKYGSRDLSPEARFAILEETAGHIPIDAYQKVEHYVPIGEKIFLDAEEFYNKELWFDAFILYTRFLSIFESRFRQHPGYKALGDIVKDNFKSYCSRSKANLEIIRERLLPVFAAEAEALQNEEKLKKRTHGSFIESEMMAELKTHMPIRRRRSQLIRFDRYTDFEMNVLRIIKKIRFDSWLQELFQAADKNRSGILEEKEIQGLLNRLNLQSLAKDAAKLFRDFKQRPTADHPQGFMGEKEFVLMLFNLIKFPFVENIYKQYAEKDGMSAEGLLNFIKMEQGEEFESMKLEDVQKLMQLNELESDDMGQSTKKMKLEGFANLLMSPTFDIFMESHRQVHQDMSRPLSDYYISSSHNTYLTGNQLTGKSDVDAYAAALKRGCRCVECKVNNLEHLSLIRYAQLDCWNGGDETEYEPMVYHGFTLTSEISFRDILEFGIVPYAFITSEYPVILSIENHCDEFGQLKMSQYLQEYMGDAIYYVSPEELRNMKRLPSPESLKRKFIIKASVRVSTLPNAENDSKAAESSDTSPKVEDTTAASQDDEPDYESDEESDDGDEQGSSKRSARKPTSKPIPAGIPELSKWINISQAVKFHSFEESEKSDKPYHISSFTEGQARKLGEEFPLELVKYNQRQLCRVYPSGRKLNSGNFDPLSLWKFGCQILALNLQTDDDKTLINKFMFSDNGNCGYILKPKLLTDPNSGFNPKIDSNRIPAQVLHLYIEVLGGFLLPQSRDEISNSPYVKIEVKGFDHDKESFTTSPASDQSGGFNPTWREKSTCHFQIQSPDFSVILFTVFDKSKSIIPLYGGDFEIGYAGIPVAAMGEGYRAIHLVDKSGQYLTPATLIVKIVKTFGPPKPENVTIEKPVKVKPKDMKKRAVK